MGLGCRDRAYEVYGLQVMYGLGYGITVHWHQGLQTVRSLSGLKISFWYTLYTVFIRCSGV